MNIPIPRSLRPLDCDDQLRKLFIENPSSFERLLNNRELIDSIAAKPLQDRDEAINILRNEGHFLPDDVAAQMAESVSQNQFEPQAQYETPESNRVPEPTENERHAVAYAEGNTDEAVAPPPVLAFWQVGKYKWAERNLDGSPFTGRLADGRAHLVPEPQYIDECISRHHMANKAFDSLGGKPWHEDLVDFVKSDEAISDLYDEISTSFENLHRGLPEGSGIWTSQSYSLRDHVEYALARRAIQLVELYELHDRCKQAAARNGISQGLKDQSDRAQQWYDQSKSGAGFWLGLWREDRIRTAGMEKTPPTDADPNLIDISYSLRRQLINRAWNQEHQNTAQRITQTATNHPDSFAFKL